MNPKSPRGCARLVLLLALLISPVCAKNLRPEVTTVTVSLFNDAAVPPSLVWGAKRVATRVFAQAGVNLEWLNCGLPSMTETERASCILSDFPTHLHLRLIWRPTHSDGAALGASYLAEDGVAFQADIFYERVAKLQSENQVEPAILLGVIMAHELGHLLLGTDSHSSAGLMRASWHREDLARAVKGSLLFSDDESDHMRAKLYEAFLDRTKTRVVVASQK